MGRNKKNRVGEIHLNKYGTPFIITKYNNNKEVYVRFLDEFAYETKAIYKQCIGGTIKNPYDKTVYGVGYHGVDQQGNYLTTNNRKGTLWKNMLVRCYSESFLRDNPTYINCDVCERWLCYANFLEDLPKIEGYAEWVNNRNYELDKDLKQQEVKNKIYRLETCCFVPSHVNSYEHHSRSCIKAKKPVIAFNFLKGLLYEFDSVSEASTILPFSDSSISMKCSGKRGQRNWIIIYKEDLPKLSIDEITYDELLKYESERGLGSLGSSNK